MTKTESIHIYARKSFNFACIVLMLSMVFALILGSKVTVPEHVELNLSGGTFSVAAFLISTLIFGLVALCIYQLIQYFSNWSFELHGKFKLDFFKKLGVFFYWCAFGLLSLLTTWFMLGLILLFVNKTVFGLNVHFDNSEPVLVSMSVLQRIPSTSARVYATLIVKNPNTKFAKLDTLKISHNPHVVSLLSDGRVASFYVRQGAFGWPYGYETELAVKKLQEKK